MSMDSATAAERQVLAAVDALNDALDVASTAGLAVDLEVTTIRAANRPDIVTVRAASYRR